MSQAVFPIIGVCRNGAGNGSFARAYIPQPLQVTREDDVTVPIVVYDQGGTPLDLTSCVLILKVQLVGADPEAPPFISTTATIDDAALGQAHFEIQQSDTAIAAAGDYTYDVTLIDASSLRTHIVPESDFLVVGEIGESDDPVTSPVPVPVLLVFGQRGRQSFSSSGPQYVDITFAGGFQFTGAYSIFLSVYNSDDPADMIEVQATYRTGDTPPGPAGSGFRILASAPFDGYVSWMAYQ